VTDTTKTAKVIKVILFNNTLTVRQCDGKWCHLFMIFAVYEVSVTACRR